MSMIPYQQLPAAQTQQVQTPPPTQAAGQWDHIPTIEQAPMPQQQQQQAMTPYVRLQEQYELTGQQIQSMYQQMEQMGLSPQELQEAGRQLQEQWNDAHIQYEQQVLNLQAIERLAQSGQLAPEQAELAMWKMVMPKDAGAAMEAEFKLKQQQEKALGDGRDLSFGAITPRVDSKGRVSPSQLDELLYNYIDPLLSPSSRWAAAQEEAPRGLGLAGMAFAPYAAYKTVQMARAGLRTPQQVAGREDIVEQYLQAREDFGYDGYDPVARRQFDSRWDALLKADGLEAWDPKAPEVQALRADGPLSKAFTRSLTPSGGPLAEGLAQSVQRKVQQREAQQARQTVVLRADNPDDQRVIQALLQEAGGNPDVAEQLAKARGYAW